LGQEIERACRRAQKIQVEIGNLIICRVNYVVVGGIALFWRLTGAAGAKGARKLANTNAAEKGNVLVIDDDPLLTKTLKKILHRAGYLVDIAQNGLDGIQKAKSGFFHLVLCDIRMPGLDGLMTIRHIKEFQEKAGVGHSGFIVVTAYDSKESRTQACQLGVTDFLMKPFDLSYFLEVIEHHAAPLLAKTPLRDVEALNQKLKRLLSAVGQNT